MGSAAKLWSRIRLKSGDLQGHSLPTSAFGMCKDVKRPRRLFGRSSHDRYGCYQPTSFKFDSSMLRVSYRPSHHQRRLCIPNNFALQSNLSTCTQQQQQQQQPGNCASNKQPVNCASITTTTHQHPADACHAAVATVLYRHVADCARPPAAPDEGPGGVCAAQCASAQPFSIILMA